MRNDAKSQCGVDWSLIRVLEMSEISEAELLLSARSALSMPEFDDVMDGCIEIFEWACECCIICVLVTADSPDGRISVSFVRLNYHVICEDSETADKVI